MACLTWVELRRDAKNHVDDFTHFAANGLIHLVRYINEYNKVFDEPKGDIVRQFTAFKKILMIFYLIFWSLIVSIQVSDAQDSVDVITNISSADAALFEWSADSTYFAFLNTTISNERFTPILPHPAWQAFDINTQTLGSPSARWALQPDIEIENFTGALSDQFLYASPDTTLFLYHQVGDELSLATVQNATNIAIANSVTGESLSLNIPSRIPFSPQSDAEVYWAGTNQAVAFSTSSAGADVISPLQIYHVTLSSTQPLEVVVTEFNARVDGQSYITRDIGDRLLGISPDGEHVLLIGTPESRGLLQPSQLLVWQPLSPQNSMVISAFAAESICQATFAPDAPERVVIRLQDGRIAIYDTLTDRVQFLAGQNLEGCRPDFFSPDGYWLATTRNSSGRIEFRNMARRIAESTAPYLRAPIANAGSDIVLDDPDGDGSALLTLDATNSTDPDGGTLSYVWSLSGPLRNNGAIVELNLSREQVGDGLQFTLTVTNSAGLIDRDTILVTFETDEHPDG